MKWRFLSSLFFFLPLSTYAYPELTRHNYASCTACHISPSGGGLLTRYGRELSSAVLSTWGEEKEGQFAHDLVKIPEWLEMGGDLRGLRMKGRAILMQADLEAAAMHGQLTAVGTLGIQDWAVYPPSDRFISRRHYLMYHFKDELAIRFGRFMQNYGLNIADHATVVRRGLGFDQGQETYNAEVSWINEEWSGFITAVFPRSSTPDVVAETGISLNGTYFLDDRFKLGANYYYGASESKKRNLFGLTSILGFNYDFFVLAELDLQRTYGLSMNQAEWGMVSYLREDYELIQGLHFFLTQQFFKPSFERPDAWQEVYGVGVQFFPRPHFEFELFFEKRRNTANAREFGDWIYFMGHYYL